jgi:cystathionine beta-lyase
MVIPNEELRKKVNRQLNDIECAEPNVLAEIAPQVAFNECEYWVDEMNLYVDQNRNLVREFLKNELPVVKMVEGDALYLIWLDFGSVIDDTTLFNEFLKEKTGLYLANGENYRGNGNKFLRMNLATQRSRVEDGLNRLKDGLLSYITQK